MSISSGVSCKSGNTSLTAATRYSNSRGVATAIGRIAFERLVGGADQRAVDERQNENRPAVAGFGVDGAAGKQLLQSRMAGDEMAAFGAAHQSFRRHASDCNV